MEFDLILRFNIYDSSSLANKLKCIIIMTRAKKRNRCLIGIDCPCLKPIILSILYPYRNVNSFLLGRVNLVFSRINFDLITARLRLKVSCNIIIFFAFKIKFKLVDIEPKTTSDEFKHNFIYFQLCHLVKSPKR